MKLEKSRGSTNFRRLLQQHYIFYQNQSWHSYSNCMTKLNWLIWKIDFMNRSIQVTQSNKWPIGQGSESNILLYSMINDISINSGLNILGLAMVSNESLSLSARQMIFLFANYLNIVNRKENLFIFSQKSLFSSMCALPQGQKFSGHDCPSFSRHASWTILFSYYYFNQRHLI